MKSRLILSPLFCAVVALTITGCATSANKDAMTATGIQIAHQHDKTVGVRTAGGVETGAMDSSNIADADLKAAIEESIAQNKVFKSVVQGKDADYELLVSIVQLDKPMFGLTFTVNLEATWALVKLDDRSVALKKTIKSSHSATVGDAFAAVTRLRLAVEGAAKKNIEQGLREIGALSL